eukprot:772686-Amphidinium_carterae.1
MVAAKVTAKGHMNMDTLALKINLLQVVFIKPTCKTIGLRLMWRTESLSYTKCKQLLLDHI